MEETNLIFVDEVEEVGECRVFRGEYGGKTFAVLVREGQPLDDVVPKVRDAIEKWVEGGDYGNKNGEASV